MNATITEREQVDPLVRRAPAGLIGAPVSRSGARHVVRGPYGGTHGRTLDADQVLVETGNGGKPARPIVPWRSEFELDTMTPPGFMSDWAFE